MDRKKLKDISTLIASGLTPSRRNPTFWDNAEIYWLKTDQLCERYIYYTNEKISQKALNETSIKIFPSNSLSIAMYGEGKTRGNVSIIKSPMTTNQACCNIVIDDSKADFKYVYYFLRTQYTELRRLSSGVRKNLNSNDIKEFEINIPKTVSAQQRIASVLSALDDKIELNNKINAELEAIAKTLYDYWFVQFDFPDSSGKPYQASGGKMVYNAKLKREIPEGWEVNNIESIANVVDCLHSKKPECQDCGNGRYLLQLENILDNGIVDTSYKYYVNDTDYSNWTSRIKVKENDILITNAGRVAATAQVSKEIIAGIGRNITAIRPTKISPTYFFLAFRGFDTRKQIKANTDQGAFFTSFNVKGIKRLSFVIPPFSILNKFEKTVYAIRRKRELSFHQNQNLSSLRDWILPMLMNGQITVKQAYKMVDEKLAMVAEP